MAKVENTIMEFGKTKAESHDDVDLNTEVVYRSRNKDECSKKRNRKTRDPIFKEGTQQYGQVLRMLDDGSGSCLAKCVDSYTRICRIHPRLQKKYSVAPGDIILIWLDDCSQTSAEVVLKYKQDEVRVLHAYEELPGLDVKV